MASADLRGSATHGILGFLIDGAEREGEADTLGNCRWRRARPGQVGPGIQERVMLTAVAGAGLERVRVDAVNDARTGAVNYPPLPEADGIEPG